MLSTSSFAFNHSVKLETSLRGEHVDNVFLIASPKDYLVSTILNQRISYTAQAPTWQGSLSASGNIRRTSDPQFDTNDQYYNGFIKQTWLNDSVEAKLSRVDTTVREISESESIRVNNDPVTTDRAYLSWTKYLSSKNMLTWSTQYAFRNYSSDSYTDYSDWQTSMMWRHHYSATFAIQSRIYYGEYASDQLDVLFPTVPITYIATENVNKTIGAQIGFFGSLSEKITYDFLIGGSTIEIIRKSHLELSSSNEDSFSHFSTKNDTDNNLFSGSIQIKGEHSRHNISLEKGLEASGNGFQFDTRSVTWSTTYRPKEKWHFNTYVEFDKQKALEINPVAGSRYNRELLTTRLSASRRLSQNWKLSAIASYVAVRYENTQDTAEALTGILQIQYTPKLITWQ